MGLLYRRNGRVLDLRQRRNHNPEQHHIRTGNKMKELEFEPLNYDINLVRDPDTQRVLPVIDYWIGERTEQAIADDNQALQLRVMHQLAR